VVARRFEEIAGARRGLREVRRTRDVEFEPTGLFVEGAAALEVIVQRCAVTLRGLWDGSDEGVALIQKASHGAKAGFLERGTAIEGLRDAARRVSLPDRTTYDGMVSSLERGPGDGRIQCILQGWGTVQILNLTRASLDTRSPREFGKPEEDVLQQYIVACRDRKRALGLFEKMLDKLGSTTVSSSLADLLSLLRHDWDDCDGILAKHAVVVEASTHLDPTEATSRLRCALSALWQATTERKRGGVVNARGGKG
jgi:hypothetical protein